MKAKHEIECKISKLLEQFKFGTWVFEPSFWVTYEFTLTGDF